MKDDPVRSQIKITLKKHVLFYLLFFIFLSTRIFAQTYPGYQTSNYAGVNSVFFNPAEIAGNRYKLDVNIFAINGFIGTDQGGLRFGDILKSLSADSLRSKLLRGHSQINSQNFVDILGPSVMYSINPGTSVAFTTRARVFSNSKDLNGDLANALIDANSSGITSPISLNTGTAITHATGWSEIGGSVAHVFTAQGNHHFFKGGITIKYLAGTADSYLTTSNLTGTLRTTAGTANIAGPATGYLSINTTSNDFKNFTFGDFFNFTGHGAGADIGLVYEWRPDMDYSRYVDDNFANKYKVKFGISLLDIGSIKFDHSSNEAANYNIQIPDGSSFNLNALSGKSIGNYIPVLDQSPYFIKGVSQSSYYTVNLPTTLQANVDYRYSDNLAFNFAAQININEQTKNFNLYNSNSFSLTPRYENQEWGVELPLNYNDLTHFNAGVAFRVGPLFIGSGSVLSALFSDSKQADLHIGIHWGILYKKKMRPDSDKDGIYDDVDKCPKEPGIPKYHGCPIPDTDGDGVNDDEDSCVSVPGVARYHGCPFPDRDNDGVIDEEDSCIDVPGLINFNGCPDTDGDGIPDKLDKCPTVAGVSKYKGCPIPDTDGDGINDEQDLCPTMAGPVSTKGCPLNQVAVQITEEFRNILFNTGKSTIRPESAAILMHAAKTMNDQIPNADFYIDGYTDNTGSAAKNSALSKSRAQAVINGLVDNGVSRSRLTARGFGKENPKCENNTPEGRLCNRRVEVLIR
jgi:outer membrane protein OmpA-like peptidoglycan-associated protein